MDSYKKQFDEFLVKDRITKTIFENEYVKYFEDAKTESHIARYSAIKTYTQRHLDEIFENARKFVSKTSLILEEQK